MTCCKSEVKTDCHKPKKESNKKDCCESDCLCVLNYAPVSTLVNSYVISIDSNSEKVQFFKPNVAIKNIATTLFRPPKLV